jgi:DNA-binding MarR family transcriptional regulator
MALNSFTKTKHSLAENIPIEALPAQAIGDIRQPYNGSLYPNLAAGSKEMESSQIDDLVVLARQMLKSRHLMEQFFEADLFSDPARDILLDLFVATRESRQVSVSSCCLAARVPSTTGLRWIARLAAREWLDIRDDANDSRRRIVSLSAKGITSMTAYLQSISRLAQRARQA